MSYARHIHSCNQWNPAGFIPFAVGETQYGWMRPAFARQLRRFPATFTVEDSYVALHPALRTFEARNSAVAEALDELVRERVLDHVMGELFPVLHAWGEQPAFLLDRAAVSAFGTRSFGQHLNGIVLSEHGTSMWIGRRAADRHTFPDQLDQMVAGGMPYGITLAENLAKECEEEAGMKKELAASARATGLISYRRETPAGLRSDTIFCYDITLPSSFKPVCSDGEVGEFYLWPLDEVARVVRETDEFKPNCNLVVIDFLLRHGLITADHPEYAQLKSGLQLL
ncbi:MAG: DUF4743 domain-containing protein [Zetaproteobacteria bacterium CG12_big_fil_rev_8_21_14_0_65_55_1124]|nr:MAG: hypothetical protein AUJ58_08070 [Zetaproteobacteria bacterium CG1_02_55_237]PIS19198.1 MAG: DUF4743 domain-containing protein [Zetaproteobacteria bacterium CG08_land_8_20_14_0_20_55_17]PIW42941.1 MAG: DUF4743 domain-containing protein [Zetaproteobacteria bacterium CG12_big_fil_rev_8_21_14_0_65_55_1124]PIY51835.1 MAG: DUF4743 domain-containing protein [Zetaproteobacteria bacterium CG_4_10_14_0_8_um_filter_55_43]PIZ39895.1 MAG: DUF4743 domain-containing protein [Zetaproteobacteria bacter